MSAILITTRTIKFRGGRSIPKGTMLSGSPIDGGWTISHPSGIEGAKAMVLTHQAREMAA